jgi:hypothetical protein
MHVVLMYKVQKTIEIENIPDFTLEKSSINQRMDTLLETYAPKDCEILDSDYHYSGESREPLPIGCEPLPTDNHWVDVDGFGKMATNGWAIVTPECPSINEGNSSMAWRSASSISKSIPEFIAQNPLSSKLHTGYFHERFLPLKSIPGLKVYGDDPNDVGHCYKGDQLIAIIMPIAKPDEFTRKNYFQFGDQ